MWQVAVVLGMASIIMVTDLIFFWRWLFKPVVQAVCARRNGRKRFLELQARRYALLRKWVGDDSHAVWRGRIGTIPGDNPSSISHVLKVMNARSDSVVSGTELTAKSDMRDISGISHRWAARDTNIFALELLPLEIRRQIYGLLHLGAALALSRTNRLFYYDDLAQEISLSEKVTYVYYAETFAQNKSAFGCLCCLKVLPVSAFSKRHRTEDFAKFGRKEYERKCFDCECVIHDESSRRFPALITTMRDWKVPRVEDYAKLRTDDRGFWLSSEAKERHRRSVESPGIPCDGKHKKSNRYCCPSHKS